MPQLRKGHTGIVELLLEKGASLEFKNKNKKTPLHLAEQNGHTDIAQLLKNKAAVRNTHRRSPFLALIFRR